MSRCKGSGQYVSLAWPPTLKETGEIGVSKRAADQGYFGGVICPECSLGLEVVHGSVALSENGRWYEGKVRVHGGSGR